MLAISGNAMSNLNIPQAADEINKRASNYAIGGLQQIRMQLKGHIRSPTRKIFSAKTTVENRAFHHGGRSELQFNIGLEKLEDGEYFRHGVAFSLETSRSLISIEVLIPKIRLFNEFVEQNVEVLSGFEMWHFQHCQRSGNHPPTPITPDLITTNVFIFLGSIQPIDHVDYNRVLADLDLLLPLYKFVESSGAVSPYKDSPEAFTFHAGNRIKKRSTTANRTEMEMSVTLRHKKPYIRSSARNIAQRTLERK